MVFAKLCIGRMQLSGKMFISLGNENSKKVDLLVQQLKAFPNGIKDHPQSYNVYDSMGEAYMVNGEKEKDLAVKYYKKSLELNPNNSNAKEMLKKIKGAMK